MISGNMCANTHAVRKHICENLKAKGTHVQIPISQENMYLNTHEPREHCASNVPHEGQTPVSTEAERTKSPHFTDSKVGQTAPTIKTGGEKCPKSISKPFMNLKKRKALNF